MGNKKFNKFDKVWIDIEKVFNEQSLNLNRTHKFDKNSSTRKEYRIRFLKMIGCLMRMYSMGILYKLGLLEKLMCSNLLIGWFEEFRKFWVDYLKNRPIDIIDFHFLRVNYRTKFQEVSYEDELNPTKFIKAWQKQENVHLLFHCIWKYAKSAYLDFHPFLRYIRNKAHILEYGCGIAPITTGLIKYCPYKKLKFTIADIKQINFLYARWKFSQKDYINSITIDPAICDNLPAQENYDVILCLTVLEHLPNPFEVIKVLHNHLKTGGILIFDYVKGEGKGLDTTRGVIEREKVLNFIEQNFKLLKGTINCKQSTGLTVVKK